MAIPKVIKATNDVLIDRLATDATLVTDLNILTSTGYYTYYDDTDCWLIAVESCDNNLHVLQTASILIGSEYVQKTRISPDGGTTWTSWCDSMTELKESKADKDLQFLNTTVTVAAFVADTTYTDYPYRAAITLTGATATMIPEVVFALTDATSGVFAPTVESYAGGIYIYASEVPEAAITIPTIVLRKAVS